MYTPRGRLRGDRTQPEAPSGHCTLSERASGWRSMVVALGLVLNVLSSAARGPAAHPGRWTAPPCAGTNSECVVETGNLVDGLIKLVVSRRAHTIVCRVFLTKVLHTDRHCPLGQRADGPTLGNGDLGAMLGGPAVEFWLTKNDFWNLAIEASDPLCRYGTYRQELSVPKMTLDTGCTITNGSDTRNSQATAGGLAIEPIGANVTTAGWAAVQHLDNATVDGTFQLSNGAVLRTESFVAAPASSLTSRISFLVTHMRVLNRGVTLNISTSPKGPLAAGGIIESWGTSASATTAAPRDGIRESKGITVAFATRTIMSTGDEAKSVLELTPGATATAVTAVASNIDTQEQDPIVAVNRAVQELTPSILGSMQKAHVDWWSQYWSRSSISLPTRPEVERFWYSSQYTIGSSVRWNGAGSSGVPKTSPGINSIWLIGGEHNGCATIIHHALFSFTTYLQATFMP